MEDEEKRLKTELLSSNRDFLTVVQGASIGQLLSNAPPVSPSPSTSTSNPPPMLTWQASAAPPGLGHSSPISANSLDLERSASTKKRRLNMTIPASPDAHAHAQPLQGSMLVDNQAHSQELPADKVRSHSLPPLKPLIAATMAYQTLQWSTSLNPCPILGALFEGFLTRWESWPYVIVAAPPFLVDPARQIQASLYFLVFLFSLLALLKLFMRALHPQQPQPFWFMRSTRMGLYSLSSRVT